MIHKRVRLSLLAAAIAACVVVPVVSASPDATAASSAVPTGPTITLLTGDKVTMGGMRGVSVQAAKGRERIPFYVREDVEGDTHVIPADAVALLAKGRLDSRLFDVTDLVEAGYDDASMDRLPLIVDHAGPTPRSAAVQVSRELPTVSASAVSVERSAAYWPLAQKAEHVWLDGPVEVSLDRSVQQIGVPAAWQAGYTGAGVTVAVLDTGIDITHPDLADAVIDARDFSQDGNTDDWFGHGTHIASIITGNGAASGGKYRGVAPDVKLLNGKVIGATGGHESEILAGMEWAATSGADIVSMSVGLGTTDGTDPLSQAVDRLTAQTGALFVVAGGNTAGVVISPSAADSALAVGAVDRDDQLASFSSRGRVDGAIKPDITAPGVGIVAAEAANNQIGEPAEEGYISANGTSFATPHVAGAAALLAQQHPDWQAEQLKAMLMGSAKPNDALSVFEQGAGRVDVAGAVSASVFASPASISNGTVQWPHDDDQPIENTLTYTNAGTQPVTLDFAVDVTGPDGSAAPQGMFTFSPARLTVPAGGQATATLTTDTTVDAAEGVFSGAAIATGDGRSVRTPVAVNREAESYDVTMRFVGHDGLPSEYYGALLVDVNNPKEYQPYHSSGTVTVRLPRGEYYFQGQVVQPLPDEGTARTADFVEPALDLTRDIELVLDARQARPIGFDLDKPNAKPGAVYAEFKRETAWGSTGTGSYLPSADYGTVMPATTTSEAFTFTAEARLAEWNGTSFEGSPYLYFVRHKENGTVPQTLRWRYRDRQFAKVRSEHAAATPGLTGVREHFLPIPLPTTLTEYYTPDVPWDGTFAEVVDPFTEAVAYVQQSEPRTYTLGATTNVRWNFGVYGPALPNGGDFASRAGDELVFNLPLTTDQGRGRQDSSAGEGTMTILRGNEVVGEFDRPNRGWAEVGPEHAVYTLRTTKTRPLARLSTKIEVAWTFTSEHVDEEQPADLPLLAVRFAPNLDDHNTAPAGRTFTIPVYVQRNGASEVGQVNTPSVEVSYDDGVTWQPATVNRHRGEWKATVQHPTGAEFVSLRSTITDPAGNTQHQTIIRAYALA
jgi:subtilisin family serine protease